MNILPPRVYCLWVHTSEDAFVADLWRELKTKEEFETWLDLYNATTLTTIKIARSHPNYKAKNVIFKMSADYRCQHNTRSTIPLEELKQEHFKNTFCPCSMSVTVWQQSDPGIQTTSNKKIHTQKYQAQRSLNYNHNPPVLAADALKFREIDSDVKKQLSELFQNGHSPSSALHVLQYDAQLKYGLEYIRIDADRKYIPSLQDCYRYEYSKTKITTNPDYLCGPAEKFVKAYRPSTCMMHSDDDTYLACTALLPYVQLGKVLQIYSSLCPLFSKSAVFPCGNPESTCQY
ncbi:hypothetical protein CAPTEDRAFT_205797 [Capitella teleta]|uniref:Uncharacterized protein n=1 Tax=Capitella teleta TaxID=283909 RepID=R7U5G8_CAPTE|nr:hypothetical protein CAPTEDRAFT_205797 [Capitella teleta]|eukprot:ELU01219.1 hypothetical protein CAPTEDRAFT_205797 [Capitella teleta]